MKNITVKELNQKFIMKEKFFLIDIREPYEINIAKIKGSIYIPMNDIPNAINKFKEDDKLIIMCRSGIRSEIICNYLNENNFTDVYNLIGGILAWGREIDSQITLY
tara:strand:+ start:260 stop:577 length:318 start_codon:yes stop_codon:yes gene_type:complete